MERSILSVQNDTDKYTEMNTSFIGAINVLQNVFIIAILIDIYERQTKLTRRMFCRFIQNDRRIDKYR